MLPQNKPVGMKKIAGNSQSAAVVLVKSVK